VHVTNEPGSEEMWRDVAAHEIGRCIAMLDDTGVWLRRDDVLAITDFGREFVVIVTAIAGEAEEGCRLRGSDVGARPSGALDFAKLSSDAQVPVHTHAVRGGVDASLQAVPRSQVLVGRGTFMAIDASIDPRPPGVKGPRGSASRSRAFVTAATVGGLALVAYAFASFRWGPLDAVGVLGLVFALLLLGYAVLAFFAVRAMVVAPFVVVALLLPWACGAAAAIGAGQRVDSVIEEFTDDLSGGAATDPLLPEVLEEGAPPADQGREAAAAAKYSALIEPYNEAFGQMSVAEEAYFASQNEADAKDLRAADSRLAVAASQAATEIQAFDAWPQSVADDVHAVAVSLRTMAEAAQLMSTAKSSEERDEQYGAFFDAQTAGAVSAAAVRDGLGIPEAE